MLTGPIDHDSTQAQTLDRLQAIIGTAMDAIITVDAAQRIIFFNPAAEQMFGISASEVMGTPIERFIPDRFRSSHKDHIVRFTDTGETGRRMGALGAISALRADGDEFPVEASISQAQVGRERLSTVILRDITERRANEEAQALLAREVDHRAKNILAIVSSLVSLTQAATREAFAESLGGRIAAMSRAHGLLSRSRWKGAPLRQIVEEELGSYAEPGQFECDGPPVDLSSRAVQPIAMLIHELVTNAVKYGALSVRQGRVGISWTRTATDEISLHWREQGGPRVTGAVQSGFGSDLITQIVENQLSGTIERRWKTTGLVLDLILPETILPLASERRSAASSARVGEIMAEASANANTMEDDVGTLLIVEDEPLLAMQMSKSLQEFGWNVIGVAGSIDEANRILAGSKRPDVAILDVDLAGIPVFPLARALRRSDIPFLFCTGYEDIAYSHEFAKCRVVRKPATTMQILRALREVVRAATPGSDDPAVG